MGHMRLLMSALWGAEGGHGRVRRGCAASAASAARMCLAARLGLYHYGDDHGAAAVVVADPLADDAAGELADLVGVGDAVGGRHGQGFLDPGQDLAGGGVGDTRSA